MAENQSSQTPAGSSFLVAVAALTGAYFFYKDAPLQGARPQGTEAQLDAQSSSERVNARVWQDPFDAVYSALRHRKEGQAPARLRCRSNPPDEDTDEQFSVIGVMAPGGAYAELSEVRRRIRYAVLSGLERKGFVADVADHLGCWMQTSAGPLPFEWFHDLEQNHILVLWLNEDALGQDEPTDLFQKPLRNISQSKPLKGILKLAHHFRNKFDISMKILGPYSSDTLVDLIEETSYYYPSFEQWRSIYDYIETAPSLDLISTKHSTLYPYDNRNKLMLRGGSLNRFDGTQTLLRQKPEHINFLTYGATIGLDAVKEQLRSELPQIDNLTDISSYFRNYTSFKDKKIDIYRTISDDGELSELINNELKHRGVYLKPGGNDHVALINEWDTSYGRTFAPTFVRILDQSCVNKGTIKVVGSCNWVHFFKYARGLDGAVQPQKDKEDVETNESSSDAGSNDSKPPEKRSGKSKEDAEGFDRPFGQGQHDYLRRLAKKLKGDDDELKRAGAAIRAIGVVGSDVFDKLLVMRALKPEFPEAIFFTTDFDYTLTMPSERGWTRNLIVASSFGPTLRDEIQGGIPPFRGSYETSAFLAAQLAVEEILLESAPSGPRSLDVADKLRAWPSPAQVYELDRNGQEIPLLSTAAQGNNEDSEACAESLLSCTSLSSAPHPSKLPKVSWWGGASALLLLFLASPIWKANSSSAKSPSAGREVAGPIKSNTKKFGASDGYMESPRGGGSLNLRGDRKTIRSFASSRAFISICAATVLLAWALARAEQIAANSAWVVWISFTLWLFWVGWSAFALERAQNYDEAATRAHDSERDGTLRPPPAAPAVERVMACFALLLIIGGWFFWPSIVDARFLYLDGEIVALSGGVSLWPVIALRFFSLLLSIALLARGLRKLKCNLVEIGQEMRLEDRQRILEEFYKGKEPERSDRPLVFLKTFIKEIFTTRMHLEADTDKYVVENKWRILIVQGRLLARAIRVISYTAIMLLFFGLLYDTLGFPNIPNRDPAVRAFYQAVSGADFTLMLLLTFFVADATLSFWFFVKQLGSRHVESQWPPDTKKTYAEKLGIPEDDPVLEYWSDVNFIAKRSSCLGELIYYPFLLLAILIFSRSAALANFGPQIHVPIFVPLGLSTLILLICAFLLRDAAEFARNVAKSVIADSIVRARKEPSGFGSAAQLEALLARVEGMQEGAFLPFQQQPPVRAVLLLFGSVGLTLLTDFGLIPGL
jgi:hypothetical protein